MSKKYPHIPPINKRAKRNRYLMPIISIVFLVIFITGVIVLFLGNFPKITKTFNIVDVATVCIAAYALIWRFSVVIKTSKSYIVKLKLKIKKENGLVLLSCDIKNVGKKIIYPYLINLYIDKGIENPETHIYDFDKCLDHNIHRADGEDFDCHLVKYCRKEEVEDGGEITSPPCLDKAYSHEIRYAYNLRSLSHFSLVHIIPNEYFHQDVVVKLDNPGVYRAILIYTGKKWDDCICTTRNFIIGEKDILG
jgi:hypothetical protein